MSIACRLHSKPAIVKGIPNHNRLSYFFEREDSSSCESTRVSLFFLFCRPTFTVVCWSSFIDAVHIFHERLHEREFGFFLPTQEELIQILKEWWLTSVRYQNKTAQETLFLETESSALSFLLSYDFVDKIHLEEIHLNSHWNVASFILRTKWAWCTIWDKTDTLVREERFICEESTETISDSLGTTESTTTGKDSLASYFKRLLIPFSVFRVTWSSSSTFLSFVDNHADRHILCDKIIMETIKMT